MADNSSSTRHQYRPSVGFIPLPSEDASEERCALTVLWKIENISLMEVKDTWSWRSVKSPYFATHSLDNKRFRIVLYTKVPVLYDKYLRVQVYPAGEPFFQPIDCELSLMGSDGSPLVKWKLRNQTMKKYKPIYFVCCPTHDKVFNTRKSEFLPLDTLTVRFRVWKHRGEFPEEEFISARSRMEVAENSFAWYIPGFSTLRLNQELSTPLNLGFSNFLLKFSLSGGSLETAGAHIELTATSIPVASLVSLKVSVLDKEQKVVKSTDRACQVFDDSNYDMLVLKDFATGEKLLSKEWNCLSNDELGLICEIYSLQPINFIEKQYCGPSCLKEVISKRAFPCLTTNRQIHAPDGDPLDLMERRESLVLGEDLLSLYDDEHLTDFSFRSGDVLFPVHKVILSARSPVFRAMFCSGMKECDSKSISIPDLDPLTLNHLVVFLYSGSIDDLDWENALKLYYAADKYQVVSLKRKCSSYLRSNVAINNVCDILTLADRHRDDELKSFVHDFISIRDAAVMSSKEWETFIRTDIELAGTTMHQLYMRKIHSQRPQKTLLNFT